MRAFASSFEAWAISVIVNPTNQQPQFSGVNACVVALDSSALERLTALPYVGQGRALIYGIGSERKVCNFPDMRLHVLLDDCTEGSIHAAVNKTAPYVRRRATLHDRVPIVTAVSLDTGTVSLNGLTVNVGCGGMAIRLRRAADLPVRVRLTWTLNGFDEISLEATPRWNSGRMVGLQYVSTAPDVLKRWIRNYSAHLKVTPVTQTKKST
jgi:PilZ domain